MKMTIALLSIATLGVLVMPAHANHNSPDSNRDDRIGQRIEQRIEQQHYRIHNGIENGKLTRKEARHLRKQQRYIIRLSYKYMQDGYLDRYEHSKLRDALDRASKRIYRLKHNDRQHYSRRYYY